MANRPLGHVVALLGPSVIYGPAARNVVNAISTGHLPIEPLATQPLRYVVGMKKCGPLCRPAPDIDNLDLSFWSVLTSLFFLLATFCSCLVGRHSKAILSTFLLELPSQTAHRNLTLGVTLLQDRDAAAAQARRRRWRPFDRDTETGAAASETAVSAV